VSRYGRYRVQPAEDNEYLSDTEAAARSPSFRFDEIKERVVKGPVRFRVAVQLAEDGDTVDEATICWPGDRAR
jgi:catalase